MFKTIKDFLLREHISDDTLKDDAELKLAIAALLVNVAGCDESFGPYERRQLKDILIDHFGLDEDEAEGLISSGQEASRNAVDLHRFVSIINQDFDNDQRKHILKYAWQVVLADGQVDNYEDSLMRKLGPLLGISRHDSIAIRDKIMAEYSRG